MRHGGPRRARQLEGHGTCACCTRQRVLARRHLRRRPRCAPAPPPRIAACLTGVTATAMCLGCPPGI